MHSLKFSGPLSKHGSDISAGRACPTEMRDDRNIRVLSAEGL